MWKLKAACLAAVSAVIVLAAVLLVQVALLHADICRLDARLTESPVKGK